MTDEEIAVALKGHEHEIGSLKHRMKDVEREQVAIHDLVISVKELALNMQHMIEEQKEQGRRLEALEKEPIARLSQIKTAIITALATAVIGSIVGAILLLA